MKRFWKYLAAILLLLVAASVGGGLYLLSYALKPDAVMAAKNASAREYIRTEYPAVVPWLDSLERTGALRRRTPADRPHGRDCPRIYRLRRADAHGRLPL